MSSRPRTPPPRNFDNILDAFESLRRLDEDLSKPELAKTKLHSANPTSISPVKKLSRVIELKDFVSKGISWITGSLTGLISVGIIMVALIFFIAFCYKRYKKKQQTKKKMLAQEFRDEPIPNFDKYDYDLQMTHGFLKFAMNYDLNLKHLQVRVLAVQNIKATSDGPLDYYVIVRLVKPPPPEVHDLHSYQFTSTSKSFTTNVVKGTYNPAFNELVFMEKSLTDVLTCWLLFDIYERDLTGRDRNYGRVFLRLPEMNTNEFVGTTVEDALEILQSPQIYSGPGDLCIILTVGPPPKRPYKILIEFTILEGKALRGKSGSKETKGQIYAVVEFHLRGKRMKSFFTRLIDFTSPQLYFNEKFTFLTRPLFITEGAIKVKMYHVCPPFRIPYLTGKLTFAQRCESGSASIHWKESCRIFRYPVGRWHKLNSPSDP